jgi:hypothetical protein
MNYNSTLEIYKMLNYLQEFKFTLILCIKKHKYPKGRDGINGRIGATKHYSPPSKLFSHFTLHSSFTWQDAMKMSDIFFMSFL